MLNMIDCSVKVWHLCIFFLLINKGTSFYKHTYIHVHTDTFNSNDTQRIYNGGHINDIEIFYLYLWKDSNNIILFSAHVYFTHLKIRTATPLSYLFLLQIFITSNDILYNRSLYLMNCVYIQMIFATTVSSVSVIYFKRLKRLLLFFSVLKIKDIK